MFQPTFNLSLFQDFGKFSWEFFNFKSILIWPKKRSFSHCPNLSVRFILCGIRYLFVGLEFHIPFSHFECTNSRKSES